MANRCFLTRHLCRLPLTFHFSINFIIGHWSTVPWGMGQATIPWWGSVQIQIPSCWWLRNTREMLLEHTYRRPWLWERLVEDKCSSGDGTPSTIRLMSMDGLAKVNFSVLPTLMVLESEWASNTAYTWTANWKKGILEPPRHLRTKSVWARKRISRLKMSRSGASTPMIIE